jgi:RNA recognition motif-containing protein
MTILQVSGFPVSFTPEQVRHLFEPFGAVQAIRPNGEGATDSASYVVEMVESEAAEAAQDLLEGIAFGDRPLHLTRLEGRAYSAVA